MARSGIMLAYPFETRRLAKWKPPYILQPKLDGDRCRAIIGASGDVVLLSSEENEIVSVPHINSALEALHLHNVELDGELYIPDAPFESIHGIVSRSAILHPDSRLIEYHIFDLVSPSFQAERLSQLLDTIPTRGTGRQFGPLQVVPSMLAYSEEDIMRQLEIYMKEKNEGFIVRDAFAPYVRKRSTQMMKFKPRKEDIYEIVGWQEEVSIDGVPKGTLGALLCRSDDSTTFSVGSGSLLTQSARKELWDRRENLVGRWARVKYQHLTHARGVPRFPVIVEIVNFGN